MQNCDSHTSTMIEIRTLETRMETRHTMNMWFLRILGAAIVLLTTAAITVGINLNTTLVRLSNAQEVVKEQVVSNKGEIDRLRNRLEPM